MERVLIVAKTRMSRWVCVGAMDMNGNFLRLLNSAGYNQPVETDFEIGQSWKIRYKNRENRIPPHLEDVLILSKEKKGNLNIPMLDFLKKLNVPIWKGDTEVLFNGMLRWTESGSGYITKEHEVPNQSVGFWLPENNLRRSTYKGKSRYIYQSNNFNNRCRRNIAYVGLTGPVDTIPAGTLIRVSLARWWDRNGETEKRCTIQLSGWYDLDET